LRTGERREAGANFSFVDDGAKAIIGYGFPSFKDAATEPVYAGGFGAGIRR
jgi:hypothetical protein